MTRLKFLLIKNNELFIYLIFFLAHIILAPTYNYLNDSQDEFLIRLNFYPLFVYNIIAALVYLAFIILFKFSKYKIFFIIAYIELIIYNIFFTITIGASFGMESALICMIPALFLYAFTSQSSGTFYTILAIIVFCCSLFVIYWNFDRSEALSSEGYYWLVKRFTKFYIVHTGFLYLLSSSLILFFSIHTERAIFRSKKKFTLLIQNLELISNHDHLTGLVNRRKINHYLNQCQMRKEIEEKDYAFTIFDIDNFKKINDTYGHEAGDFILLNLAQKIQSFIKGDQLFGRWGGEEFVILFNEYSPKIFDQLENIRIAVSQMENIWQNNKIKITLTFGVSSSNAANNTDQIINEADYNLLIGKQNGKNQVVVSETFK